MADHVLRAGAACPDQLALQILHGDQTEDWTYAALIAAVRGTATGLLQHAQAGQMVLMRLGNTVDFPIAYLGAIWAGLVPIPTSAALTDAEVAAILNELPVATILRSPAPTMRAASRWTRCKRCAGWHRRMRRWAIPTGWPMSSIPLALPANRVPSPTRTGRSGRVA